MKYVSKAQQGYFHVQKRLAKLAKAVDKATYKGKPGGKANSRKFSRMPRKVKPKKS